MMRVLLYGAVAVVVAFFAWVMWLLFTLAGGPL
jgi:hypothetical protein